MKFNIPEYFGRKRMSIAKNLGQVVNHDKSKNSRFFLFTNVSPYKKIPGRDLCRICVG
jgi:hypothetical protein